MTTLQPRSPYSDDEIAKLYPQSLELQQVQILLRHGERTPVNARFKNTGLPAYWSYCEAARNFRYVILSADRSWDTLHWKRRLETFGPDDAPALAAGPKEEVDTVCQPGELTDRGRETTLALGQRTRKLYVDQLGFLPSGLDAASSQTVYLRSTPIQRALESTQQAFTGLYPPSARSPDLQPPSIVTRSMQDETLFPNEGACKRFAQLSAAFADRTAQLWNDSPELAYVNRKIGKWMPKESPVVKVDSHPRLSGIMDTINATLAHGPNTKLPSEFYDERVVANIDRICTEEWFVGYQESNEYRTLGIGGTVGDLTQRMIEHVSGKPAGAHTAGGDFKIGLSGCHDTTLAATLTALGVFDALKDKWPNYTSSIAIELFKRKDGSATAPSTATTTGAIWPAKEKRWWSSLFSSSAAPTASARTPLADLSTMNRGKLDDNFVRLRYNDRPLTLPFCQQAGRHLDGDESFCTLAAFKEAADSFTPKNWKAECSMNLGEPGVRPVLEKPPGL
ncbi:hypothetical protein LTR85_003884 [Meristemomyces frigidus]|nr:hypothetical protein LTR85_003884 [Meristemomyces frigidus]